VNADYLTPSSVGQSVESTILPDAATSVVVYWRGRAYQVRADQASLVRAKIAEEKSLTDLISSAESDLRNIQEQLRKAGPFRKKALVRRAKEITDTIETLKKQKTTTIEKVEQLLRIYATEDHAAR
jgi:hypothetical protein